MLIGRREADGVVFWPQQGDEKLMVGPRRAVCHHNLLRGGGGAEQRPYAAKQRGRAIDVPIGQALVGKQCEIAGRLLPRERQKLSERERVHTGLGEIVGGVVFIGVHPLFYKKGLDVHGDSSCQ